MDGLRAFFLLAVIESSVTPATAENWPQFRGPEGSGHVTGGTLPTNWSLDQHVAWKVAIPGVGWSQPVVWQSRIFVTTAVADDQPRPQRENRGTGLPGPFGGLFSGEPSPPDMNYRWQVLCLDGHTGSVLWEQTAREGRPKIHIHPSNSYASETPVTDGERLVVSFGMHGVYCYDLDGKLLWSKDLGSYPTQFGWGTGSSPVMHGDLVYLQFDNEKSSFLVALHKHTGEEVWRVPRDEQSNWATPYLWKNKLGTELVTAGGRKFRSYRPETGELLWEMDGSGRTSVTPVGNDELLYVDSYDRLTGRTGRLAVIRAGATGNLSSEEGQKHIVWSGIINGFRVASPLLLDDYLYIVEQQSGIIRCLNAKTGEQHYRERLPEAAGFTASPLANDGKVFCLNQDGRTYVLAGGPKFTIFASNPLEGMFWASPVPFGDRLLLRSVDHLYCIAEHRD